MTKIQDVVIPSKGTAKYFSIKCLNLDIKKSSEATPTFYWGIQTEVSNTMNEVETLVPGQTILDGNLSMTAEEYALWGSDDAYVIDWALAKLGFTEIA